MSRCFKPIDIASALDAQGGVCNACRKPLPVTLAHGDHIMPYSSGWPTDDWNLQALCERCNIIKGSKDGLKWMIAHGADLSDNFWHGLRTYTEYKTQLRKKPKPKPKRKVVPRDTVKIEVGVPMMGEPYGHDVFGAPSEKYYPFDKMNVGDSIFVKNAIKGGNVHAAANNFYAQTGREFEARGYDNGLRIWRIS